MSWQGVSGQTSTLPDIEALHAVAQQQLAEVQKLREEKEHLEQQRALEQQQLAEVQQCLQGQRKVEDDLLKHVQLLEEKREELQAQSREQEQAMLELKRSKAFVVEELQAQLEELQKKCVAPTL